MAKTEKTKIILEGKDAVTPVVKNARQSLADLTKEIKNQGKTFAELGNAIKGGLVFGAFNAVSGAVSNLITAYADAEKQQAKMEAVFKNTGATIGITVGELNALADSWKSISGVDDDVIKGAETTLLTFDKIGKDTFPKALEASMNLSQIFGDLDSASKAVGKALDSPIEGLTALSKIGVRFSDEQKKQIEQFVKTNDVASAQKIILDELGSKFGGVAAEMGKLDSAKFDQLKLAIDDLAKYAGKNLSRAFGGVAENLAKSINNEITKAEVSDYMATGGSPKNPTIKKVFNRAFSDNAKLSRGDYAEAEKALEAFRKGTGKGAKEFYESAKPFFEEEIKSLLMGAMGTGVNDGYIKALKDQLKQLDELAKIEDKISASKGVGASATKAIQNAQIESDLNAKAWAEKRSRLQQYYLEGNRLAEEEAMLQAEYMEKYYSELENSRREYSLYANALADEEGNAMAELMSKNVDSVKTFQDELNLSGGQILSVMSGVTNILMEMEQRRAQQALANIDAEMQALTDRYNAEKKSKEDLGLDSTEIDRKYQADKLSLEKRRLEKENEIGKKVFESQKAMNIAEAIMSGANATLTMFKQGGLIGGPIGATIMAGITAAQLALIASQEYVPKYATGGIVPGRAYSGDSILARVNSGEMVLNRQQQSKLFDIANGGGSSKSPMVINVHVSGNIVGVPDLALEIGNELSKQKQLGYFDGI